MTWFVRGGASRDAYGGPGVTSVGRAHCGAVCLTVCLSPLSLLPLIHLSLYQGGQSSPALPLPWTWRRVGVGRWWGVGAHGACPEPRPSQDAKAGAPWASLNSSPSLKSPLGFFCVFCFVLAMLRGMRES